MGSRIICLDISVVHPGKWKVFLVLQEQEILMRGIGDPRWKDEEAWCKNRHLLNWGYNRRWGNIARAQRRSHVVASRRTWRLPDRNWDHGVRDCRADVGRRHSCCQRHPRKQRERNGEKYSVFSPPPSLQASIAASLWTESTWKPEGKGAWEM